MGTNLNGLGAMASGFDQALQYNQQNAARTAAEKQTQANWLAQFGLQQDQSAFQQSQANAEQAARDAALQEQIRQFNAAQSAEQQRFKDTQDYNKWAVGQGMMDKFMGTLTPGTVATMASRGITPMQPPAEFYAAIARNAVPQTTQAPPTVQQTYTPNPVQSMAPPQGGWNQSGSPYLPTQDMVTPSPFAPPAGMPNPYMSPDPLSDTFRTNQFGDRSWVPGLAGHTEIPEQVPTAPAPPSLLATETIPGATTTLPPIDYTGVKEKQALLAEQTKAVGQAWTTLYDGSGTYSPEAKQAAADYLRGVGYNITSIPTGVGAKTASEIYANNARGDAATVTAETGKKRVDLYGKYIDVIKGHYANADQAAAIRTAAGASNAKVYAELQGKKGNFKITPGAELLFATLGFSDDAITNHGGDVARLFGEMRKSNDLTWDATGNQWKAKNQAAVSAKIADFNAKCEVGESPTVSVTPTATAPSVATAPSSGNIPASLQNQAQAVKAKFPHYTQEQMVIRLGKNGWGNTDISVLRAAAARAMGAR